MSEHEWNLAFAYLPRIVQGRLIWLRWYACRVDYHRPEFEHRWLIPGEMIAAKRAELRANIAEQPQSSCSG